MKKFLLIFWLLILTTPGYCQIDNFLKSIVTDFSGGQNSNDYADTLKPSEGTSVINAVIKNKGQAYTREGQALFNVDTASTAFNGFSRFDLENAGSVTSYMIVASAPSVISSLSNSSNWTIINAGHNITAGHDVEFVQANNKIFMFNGFDQTSWWDGSTWNVGGTYPGVTSPPTVTTATWLNGYLFAAGNSSNPDYIYVSDNGTPESFQGIQVIKIQSGDGQPIKKLANYRTGDIMVYKERAIYDYSISGVDSSCTPQPICQWSYTPVTQDVGTLSPRSVVSLGNDQWFLSSAPFAVRSVVRSQFDKTFVNMVSQPIQDIFDGTNIDGTILNTQQVQKAAAIYFDNKYILAIPVTGSNVNNLVLVYDFITSSWYEITGWYPAQWLVYNYNLYYIDANDGRVVQCFTGTTGDIGTTYPASSPTVAIPFTYVSKLFDFDNSDNYKQLDSIQLEFNPTGNYNASIYLNIDNTGWQSAGTIALTSKAITLPVNLPFTLTSPGITYGTLDLTKFGEFKKIQVKVELNGLGEQIVLQKITVFARLKPWRRE